MVYRAASSDGCDNYAWKELKFDALASDADRFRQEVDILSKLHHDHIIDIVFTDLNRERPYFVMPKAQQNLETAIKYDTNQRLDIRRIFVEICQAIIYAHDNGVLHRDLKPQNILLTSDNSVKVCDFGLAKNFHSQQQGLTEVNETGGTRAYAAPEQFDTSLKDVNVQADVYSLGKILYYLHTKEEPHRVEASNCNVPEGIYALVRKATDPDRGRRHASVTALLQDFLDEVQYETPKDLLSNCAEPESGTNKYVAIQVMAQNLAKSAKNEGYSQNGGIEQVARGLQKIIWLNRDLLWQGCPPNDPLEILDPTVALNLLGFSVDRPVTLGTYVGNGQRFEVAGQINQEERVVSVSDQFNSEVKNFTEAHELGHAMLHTQRILHRDRSIEGLHSSVKTAPEEHQADKFAAYFLMPKKLVLARFKGVFGTTKFEINRRTAEALILDNADALISQVRNRRGLARLLASSKRYGTRHVNSLAESFGVSVEAMAIRLEEIGVVATNKAY